MKKTKVLVVVVVVVVAAVLVLLWRFDQGEASKQEYKFAALQRGSLQAIVSSTGTINPLNTVKVGSQVSGKVMEINADYNSEVKKGDVIARIDPAIYAALAAQAGALLLRAQSQLIENDKDIEAARAGVTSAEAGISSAQATLHEAELRYNRLQALVGKDTVAQSENDKARAQFENAVAAVKVAQAKLEAARVQLSRVTVQKKGIQALVDERDAAREMAEVNLKYCAIASPIDGVVIQRSVDVGQTVAATLQSPVLFTIAEDLAKMQLEVDVSESDVGQIAADQKVDFTVDAFPDRKFKATVRQVRNYPTSISNVVTYKVIADVNNDDLLLRPGMTANVSIIVAQETDALKVPNAALRFKPLGEIQEAAPQPQNRLDQPAKETEQYKELVERLKLDRDQAKALEALIAAANAKLKSALGAMQDRSEGKMIFRTYMQQMDSGIKEFLKPEQKKPYAKYVREKMKAWSERRKNNGKPGTVYVIDEESKPKEVKVVIGITNETETQLLEGPLKEGDNVITGLDFSAAKKSKGIKNPLMGMVGRR